MDILVVEDNFLVGEMIRLAVEDAWFNVVGPASTVEEGLRLAESSALGGAVLDIKVGGDQVFPLARYLRKTNVPVIFVSGYDRSILPADMRTATLISKPVLVKELTQITTEHFSPGAAVAPGATDFPRRAETLRQRVAAGERRVATQQRRLEKLQFEGHGPHAIQLATDLLAQMQVSLDLLRQTLVVLERTDHALPATAAAGTITRPINDDLIDPGDSQSIAHWAERLGTTPNNLSELLLTHQASARVIARALGLEKYEGPSRKSTVPV
jgi:DNA-binding response OmpR family regulator